MSCNETWRPRLAKGRSFPPEYPVHPNVVRPFSFAHSTARRIFGLLPEPAGAHCKFSLPGQRAGNDSLEIIEMGLPFERGPGKVDGRQPPARDLDLEVDAGQCAS
jgi:hypothetical protein